MILLCIMAFFFFSREGAVRLGDSRPTLCLTICEDTSKLFSRQPLSFWKTLRVGVLRSLWTVSGRRENQVFVEGCTVFPAVHDVHKWTLGASVRVAVHSSDSDLGTWPAGSS